MSEPDVSGLMTVPQGLRILDGVPVRPRVRRIPLSQALGLRLAEELKTDRDYPPFDKSQMDGFAVRQADVAQVPVNLKLAGEVAAGESAEAPLQAGQAIAIMTGAPMPQGADGVVPVEDTEKIDAGTVRILSATKPGRFIAPRGSDAKVGQVLLKTGTKIGAPQIAVAATIGAAEIDVFEQPKVAVLATGNELVAIDQSPGPAQIRNANAPMLVALLERLGCEVANLGVAPDDPDAIREALRRGLAFEALFVTGGMSMGEYDYVPRLLVELGVELKITKLRIKPGKPFVFGVFPGDGSNLASDQDKETRRQGDKEIGPATSQQSAAVSPSCLVFGLPGNPVSAFVCASRLAGRVIGRMAGGTPEERWLTGRLDTGLGVNGPREFYQPAIRTVAPGRDSTHGEFATITPLNWVGSADLFTLARANVLIVRPENDPPLPRGTVLRVLEI
jgi:molybdopterin molybdotransferase